MSQTKIIYTFNDGTYRTGGKDYTFEDYNDVLKCIREWAEDERDGFEEYVNDTYGEFRIGDRYYDAWDILEWANDEEDLRDEYIEYLIDNCIEETEVAVLFLYDGEKYDTREDAEAAVYRKVSEKFRDYINRNNEPVRIYNGDGDPLCEIEAHDVLLMLSYENYRREFEDYLAAQLRSIEEARG